MAYADQSVSGRRTAAFVITALLHAVLLYAFVTGLAYNVIKKAAQDLKKLVFGTGNLDSMFAAG